MNGIERESKGVWPNYVWPSRDKQANGKAKRSKIFREIPHVEVCGGCVGYGRLDRRQGFRRKPIAQRRNCAAEGGDRAGCQPPCARSQRTTELRSHLADAGGAR